jgi:hypothetical protein
LVVVAVLEAALLPAAVFHIDTTIKTIYGYPGERAEVGYNPGF